MGQHCYRQTTAVSVSPTGGSGWTSGTRPPCRTVTGRQRTTTPFTAPAFADARLNTPVTGMRPVTVATTRTSGVTTARAEPTSYPFVVRQIGGRPAADYRAHICVISTTRFAGHSLRRVRSRIIIPDYAAIVPVYRADNALPPSLLPPDDLCATSV